MSHTNKIQAGNIMQGKYYTAEGKYHSSNCSLALHSKMVLHFKKTYMVYFAAEYCGTVMSMHDKREYRVVTHGNSSTITTKFKGSLALFIK